MSVSLPVLMIHPLSGSATGAAPTLAAGGGAARSEIPGDVSRLTRGLAAGSEDDFREFHRLYFARLYQFLLVVARGEEQEAKEVLQETLVRVARYVRPFESEEVFWSWLKRVARSAAQDRGRKHQRYSALVRRFEEWWNNLGRPETPPGDHDLTPILHEALENLDPAGRSLLEERYLEGVAVKDLALRTGRTERAVESHLLRLRREMREVILKKLKIHERS